MKYNQPFGVADTNASYVNGNPATGTAGSIPPAASIEYDQREIVRVIQYAKDNNFPGCNSPTNSELDQLLKAIQGFLAQRYINTAVTKTVHGTSPDFANLYEAMEWVAQYIITQAGSVTFQVRGQAGTAAKWTYSAGPVIINHPNADRIFIEGAALNGAAPVTSTFTYTGRHQAGDGSADITALRAIFATELSFTGTNSHGFVIKSPGITFRRLLITGTQVGTGSGMYAFNNTNLDTISIWGFGKYGLLAQQCDIELITSAALCSVFNTDSGIVLWDAMLGFIGNIIAVSNGSHGISALVSTVTNSPSGGSGITYCRSNTGFGLVIDGGSYQTGGTGSVFTQNGQSGVIVSGTGLFNGNNGEYSSNVGNGLAVQGGAFAYCGGTAAFSGNGANSINASDGGQARTEGATGVVGTCTPAVNTLANANAYISH